MTFEPKSLIDDPDKPAYVRDLLRQARDAKGPPYDLEAGLVKHKALIASGTPLPDWAHGSLADVATAGSLAAKLAGFTSISVLVGGVVWGASMMSGRPTIADQVKDAPSLAAERAPAKGAEQEKKRELGGNAISATDIQPMSGPDVSSQGGSRNGHPRTAESRAVPEKVSAGVTGRASQAKGSRRSASGPPRSVQGSDTSAVASPAEPATAVAATKAAVEASKKTAVQGPPPAPTQNASADTHHVLQREMVLLAEARRRLDGQPAHALALAQAGQPRTGMLSEEWEQVRLLALLQLGRIEQVRREAGRFRRLYPNSAFNERIRNELKNPAR